MDTLETLKEILADSGRESVRDEDTLEELAVDSLEMLDLMNAVEDAFSIRIADDQWPDDDATVADLAEMIDGLRVAAEL